MDVRTVTLTVTVRELATGQEHVSRHRTGDPDLAVRRALVRRWGPWARLLVDRDLATAGHREWTRYGQVGVAPRDGVGAADLVTGRVRVTVTGDQQ